LVLHTHAIQVGLWKFFTKRVKTVDRLFLEKMCGMILFDPKVGLKRFLGVKGQFDLELPLQNSC